MNKLIVISRGPSVIWTGFYTHLQYVFFFLYFGVIIFWVGFVHLSTNKELHKQRCLIESQIIVIQRLRENKHNRTIGMLQCCITENAHVRRFVVHRNTIGYLWGHFHIRLMHLLNRQCLAFLPVSKPRTNKLYFCRQCMYIVYICIWDIKMYIFICPTSIKLKFSRELQWTFLLMHDKHLLFSHSVLLMLYLSSCYFLHEI